MVSRSQVNCSAHSETLSHQMEERELGVIISKNSVIP